jgi:hypothetical protein
VFIFEFIGAKPALRNNFYFARRCFDENPDKVAKIFAGCNPRGIRWILGTNEGKFLSDKISKING